MSTYTDALYNAVALNTSANEYFTLSANDNVVTLLSAGTFAGIPVVGIAYDLADWAVYLTTDLALAYGAGNLLSGSYLDSVTGATTSLAVTGASGGAYGTVSAIAGSLSLLAGAVTGTPTTTGTDELSAGRDQIEITPFHTGGVSLSADPRSILTVGVSATSLPFAVLLANRQAVELSYVAGTLTYVADLSGATYTVSDKNWRRKKNLGF